MERIEFSLVQGDAEWDRAMLGMGLAHPYQSTAYGAYHDMLGYRVEYVAIWAGGRRIGGCCVYRTRAGLASWVYGPVVEPAHRGRYAEIVEGLVSFQHRRGAICLDNCFLQTFYEKGFYSATAPRYGGDMETPYIDLTRDLETIHGAFDRSIRKNARKCQEAGVEVFISRDAGHLQVYLEMLKYHRSKMGFGMPSLYPNPDSMRLFDRPGVGMDIAVSLVDGKPLAGLGFITFGGMVVEVGAAQSEEFLSRKLPAYELIKVKVIEHYRAQGRKVYDLMGVKLNPPTEKEANIRRFKLKFTSDTAEVGRLDDRVLRPMIYRSYRFGGRIKRALTGVFR